ncbi:hypothetical protein GLOIN_2v1735022 [Rhizophagus clarus]|uniref:Uncharacterized protein n=1 Tax=Rhizophagus clarus TaxID=94130 RepID=A0A8H3R4N0_9GLOM|nr:hypothetical protein GLOIN_2v1735022 [Rhizophagus clarus]
MAHPLSEQVRADEKREKRLNSLELRTIEVENTLLRTSKAALEKRVAELEASLRESNEECNKLRQTIAHMNLKSSEKDVTPSKKEENIEKNLNDIDNSISEESISNISKEEEIIYERILKLVENMKSDCQKAINMKIPTESQLPMRPMRQSSKSFSSKSPSPTDGLISPSKMIGRPWTPSIGISIPASRAATPSSGAISPPNSQIPTKNSVSPTKTSHIPSRSNTPSGNYRQLNSVNSVNPIQNIPVAASSNKKQRPRTGSCCSSNPSRSHTPSSSSLHSSTGCIITRFPVNWLPL